MGWMGRLARDLCTKYFSTCGGYVLSNDGLL